MSTKKPHIAILGAGPTGLDAALAAAEHDFPFTLYEAAPQVAGPMREWGHVRLFTPWSMNASPRMRQHLEAAGHAVPKDDDRCPTGAELVEKLLQPVADLPSLRGHLRVGCRVERIGRQGLMKHEAIGSTDRATHPFRLLVRDPQGEERVDEANVVLDCTGNTAPNALGDGGIPALGERELDGEINHRLPDLGCEAAEWAGRTVLLVGAGHSAQTVLRDLLPLIEGAGTRVIWALRSEAQPSHEDVEEDPLPERGRLILQAARLMADPPAGLAIHRGVVVDRLRRQGHGIEARLCRRDGSAVAILVDRVLAMTGSVGDHLLYRQLQVHECYATSGPMKLAAALLGSGASGGDCLAQTSQGAETLINPEPRFFILGIKSYGRSSNYLLRVGWQQVDEVFSLLED